jgi:putative DNA primase/helicase
VDAGVWWSPRWEQRIDHEAAAMYQAVLEETGGDEESARQLWPNGYLAAQILSRNEPPNSFEPTEIAARAHLTDAGNAETFVAAYGEFVRFDHARDRWLVWQGHRWQPDADAAVERMALETARMRHRASGADVPGIDRAKLASWAVRSENAAKLTAMLRVASTLKPVADSGEGGDTTPGIVCAPNGVIDPRTGQQRAGRPEDRITRQLGIAYDPAAICPTFDRFLLDITQQDVDLVRYLQRLFGYSLTGEATADLILFLMGVGRNGKSTLLNVSEFVFGEYAHDLAAIALLAESRGAHTTEVRYLELSRLATAKELADQKLNASRLKQLCGGDGVIARGVFQDNVTFPQTWQLWLMTNHEPRIDEASAAVVDRVAVIPFKQRYLKSDPTTDPEMEEKLRAEAPGILRWMAEGARDFYREGFGPTPDSVQIATADYLDTIDPLSTLLSDR